MIEEKHIEIIIETLKPVEPKIIILFGSVAENTANTESDIDIAFFTDKDIDNIERFNLQESIASRLDKDVDLVDMSKSDDVLNFQIAAKGKVIFSRDKNFTEKFLDLAFMKYFQLNEDRREILKDRYG